MRIHRLEREQSLPHPVEDVFAFFADARNLERLTPPLLRFEVLTPGPIEMRPGALIEYRLRLHGVGVDWLTRIEEWEPGVRFVDMQLAGPYRLWHHTHTFERCGSGTLMRDTVRYALPAWPLGELARPLVRRDLDRIFAFRRDNVVRLLDFIK
jgi:ligand-binding SRPBCC domain-containing protein